MQKNEIEKLSDREHILLRPTMYIGAINSTKEEHYIFQDNKIEKKEVEYVPALFKMCNEVIDNSIDEYVRTNGDFANKIDIKISDQYVEVKDNGRGIPVTKVKGTDKYGPEIAFTEAKSGSNFKSGSSRTTIGMNGIGAAATNVFSLNFNVDTADGKKKFSLRCEDNLSKISHKITNSSDNFTRVKFKPDLKRFGLETITQAHKDMIYQRLLYLSVSYPGIKFRFNDKYAKMKNGKELVKYFSEVSEIVEKDDFFISVIPSPSDDFSFFTYVNGLYVKSGGNHIDYITNEIVSGLRDKLAKKYKGIKPGDIKNKIQVIMFMNKFPDTKWSSQTKEQLTNSVGEIKSYLDISPEELDKFINKIYKNKVLVDDITETFRVKEELKKRKELKGMSKTTKRLNIEKYLPAAKNNKYLVLCEGDCLAESEKIKVIENDRLIDKELKDVMVGDSVITHDHNIKSVINKSTGVKQKAIIKLKDDEIIASHNHKLFVYDKEEKIMKSIPVKDIDKSKHLLVKSKLGNIEFISEIKEVKHVGRIENKYNYKIIFSDGEMLASATHKYLVFIPEELKFYMVISKNLQPGMNLVVIEGDSI